MKITAIPLVDGAGFLLIPTPGQPSLLSYTYTLEGANPTLTVLNADSGMNVLQLRGADAVAALERIRTLANAQ